MNEKRLQYYLGTTEKIYFGYTADKEIAATCASGGIVTTVFQWLLQNSFVDACLVYRLECEGGGLKVKHALVKNTEELLNYGGSIYIDFPALTLPVINEIKNFEGKIAVVGLPCHINTLRQLCKKDPILDSKIGFTLGLFCGHTSKKELIETVLRNKGYQIEDIKAFSFRKGLWRGNATVSLHNGNEDTFPTSHFTTYQNLFIDSPERCMRCVDHFAEYADLSTGDIWKKEFKNSDRKHSLFAARKHSVVKIIDKMISEGILRGTETNQKMMFQANKRAAVFHKAIRARAMVGRIFGFSIKTPEQALTPRWNEIVAACVIFPIISLSKSQHRQVLFYVPRKVLYGVLVIFKLFTNF